MEDLVFGPALFGAILHIVFSVRRMRLPERLSPDYPTLPHMYPKNVEIRYPHNSIGSFLV
jgi:hypothetical protein